jgi:hypothetical protein
MLPKQSTPPGEASAQEAAQQTAALQLHYALAAVVQQHFRYSYNF